MSEKSKNFLKTAKETDYFEKAFSKAIVFKADKDLISSLKKKFNSQENGEFVVLNKNDVKKLCSDDKKFDTLSSLLSKNPKMELDKTNNTLSTSINNCLKNRD
jgi:predicted oxidoreductase (fatty acid repression mutant protein)